MHSNKQILISIALNALKDLAPGALLRQHLPIPGIERFRRVIAISMGKAAKAMAKEISSHSGRKPDCVLLADSGHPLPTARGTANTKKILATGGTFAKNDLAIVLISGGGSAMLALPGKGITLQDKIKISRALIKSGAAINEINIVRKHISRVKGGRLAQALYPARVIGFILSDVAGNDLSTIASGPLLPDKSTVKDAMNILKKYKIKLPRRVILNMRETPKPGAEAFKNVSLKIIADHSTVRAAAKKYAAASGFKTKTIKKSITGEAREVAKKLMRATGKMRKNSILIASGETTVTCRGKGAGGRNQELVLAALPLLKKNQTILALGTDGVDGMCPENIAGAVADSRTREIGATKKLSIKKYLENNDSYSYFKRAGGHIKTGPTGTNLGDLVLILSN